MIERNKLGLKEITLQEYSRLMTNLGKGIGKHHRHSYNRGDWGLAMITEPLKYSSYYDLLKHFAETRNARRASVQYEKGKWLVKKVRELDNYENIKLLVDNAFKRGFLYISFFGEKGHVIVGANNEIGFEPINPNRLEVISTSIEIPGEERELYRWDGSKKPYFQILGIYVPHL